MSSTLPEKLFYRNTSHAHLIKNTLYLTYSFVPSDKIRRQANKIRRVLVYLIKIQVHLYEMMIYLKCSVSKLCGEHLGT